MQVFPRKRFNLWRGKIPLWQHWLRGATAQWFSSLPPLPDPNDATLSRENTGSRKWERFGPAAIPLWVADMDFRAPQKVIESVVKVATHGVYGYSAPSSQLKAATAERLQHRYGFPPIDAEEMQKMIRFLPGLIPVSGAVELS